MVLSGRKKKNQRNRTMSKAEEFIKAKTRIGSNTTKGWRRKGAFIPSYSLPWLTPDEARKAVEIAREEILLNVAEWIKDTFIFSENAKKDFCQTFNIKLL